MRVDLNEMQEQCIASETRSRCDIQRMPKELRAGRIPVAIYTSLDRLTTLKIDFKEFFREHKD